MQAFSRFRISPWSALALTVAALVMLPIGAVLWLAAFPTENIWPHLWATTLPRYLTTTVVLMSAVGLGAALIGTGTAWLVAMTRFPGHRWLQWALLLPLSVPAYVGAYALVDFLEYAGPVQTVLRRVFGWSSARDYWFPQVRSLGMAVLVLVAALYPYVYLLARAAFREQSGSGYDVARALGSGPVARLWRIGLPLARPAIAAGTAVVMMETVNDFGTVDYFAVQTLTTGIFSLWIQAGNVGGAAQLSALVLAMIVGLVTLERLSRRRARHYGGARRQAPVTPRTLRGASAWAAAALCATPVLIGFILPVSVMAHHAIGSDMWHHPGLIRAVVNTVTVGGLAAAVSVIGALVLVYGVRLAGGALARHLLPVTAIGYAVPGAVLGLGLLIGLSRIDNAFADTVLAATGHDPGLLLTGSAAALVIAYAVRFFAIPQGATDAALGRVSPSLPMAARSLGRNQAQVLRQVYLPLIKGSVGSALLLVFVDAVKELPATLMLRPFGYSTLATLTHERASLENLSDAAPPALMVSLVGLVAVVLLARANR